MSFLTRWLNSAKPKPVSKNLCPAYLDAQSKDDRILCLYTGTIWYQNGEQLNNIPVSYVDRFEETLVFRLCDLTSLKTVKCVEAALFNEKGVKVSGSKSDYIARAGNQFALEFVL